MKRLLLTASLGLLCHVCLIGCQAMPIKGSKSESLRQPQLFTMKRRQLGVGPRLPGGNEPKDGKGKGDKGDASKHQDNIDNERDGVTGGDPIVMNPTALLTDSPSILPTTMTVGSPTLMPTDTPSESQSAVLPTDFPTDAPSILPSVSSPTGLPSDAPSILPSVSSPTGLPSDAPSILPSVVSLTGLPTDTSSILPSASPNLADSILPTSISTTTGPTNQGNNLGIITRSLLPFEISVQGEESELQMVQIPLELSVNELLSAKMDDSFESFKEITLSTTELGVVQRQASRKSFGFSGNTKFVDRNVPTTEEVQDVQQRALIGFSFELQGMLNERNVSVNVVDISVEDDEDTNQQDGDDTDDDNGDGGDSSEDTSSARGGIEVEGTEETSNSTSVAIGVGVAGAVLVLLCALLLYLQQRKPKIDDNKELDLLEDQEFLNDPDLDVDAPVDHMIDTSAAANSQRLATGEFA